MAALSSTSFGFGGGAICFLASVPSGGVLLAKVWGIAEMKPGTLGLAAPRCAGLIATWAVARSRGRSELADALAIGFLGGALGTLAYDAVRVPFTLFGFRVFAPISA